MSHWPSAKEVFADALVRPLDQREAFLAEVCGDNARLLEEIHQLIAAHERATELRSPAAAAAGPVEGPGSVIGNYTLRRVIGQGGFGTIYLAEQQRPVSRRVALKIIKPGMDTAQVIGRFEAERQALAMMDHPNIAKVLDAGATRSGRPYFVMELVQGRPITEYCDANRLSLDDRLRLMVQVCEAVQHAHTKGVIHRDLKPSNILVSVQDGRPLARIIDFGIAKATQQRSPAWTEAQQLIGTPEYMSPEQAAGSFDIDTRTDVYSLGVVLYELLTGSTPFDSKALRTAAYAELQRIIREVEPPKPSTRISQAPQSIPSVASLRGVEPRKLGTIIRGELDWIVMKALDKERGRRYVSASALALDLERYLTDGTVAAAPPSLAYRLRKFTRRNRSAVAAAAMIAAALVLGVIGTSIGMVKARAERDRAVAAERLATSRLREAQDAKAEADRLFRTANAVTEFFTQDVLNPEPTPPGQPEMTVRQALERVPEKIEKYFHADPAVEGAIRERVGQLYLNMGEPRRAAEFLGPSVALLSKGLGPDHPTTLIAEQRLGELMLELERYDQAEAIFDHVYTSRLKVLGPNENFTINSRLRRGYARVNAGDTEAGLRDAEEAAAAFKRLRGGASRPALVGERTLIESYLVAKRFPTAESDARGTLQIIRQNPADLANAEPDFRVLLGEALLGEQRFEEALSELEPVYESERSGAAALEPDFLDLRVTRARVLIGLHRDPEATAELAAVYAIQEPRYGASAARCRRLAQILADLAERSHDPAAAERWKLRASVSPG